MNYFGKISAALLKIFPKTTAKVPEYATAETHKEIVKSEDVGNYLSALKKEGKDATIMELCEKFKIEDDFKMANIIGDLENAGKAFLNGFKPVYREDGGLLHLAKYTGAVKEQ